MNRIGVLTSGGDAPGMNANVRAVVRAAAERGLRVYGIERGYQGLLDGALRELTARDVSGVISRGGTFLRTARCAEFLTSAGRARGAAVLREHGVEGVVGCGGDGTFHGLKLLHDEHGFQVAGTAGTIDNDLLGTDHTIGYDTAVGTAVEACDRIRDTADSHDRIFVVEVMGRHCGWIALETALAAGAEAVLLPERPDLGLDHLVGQLEQAAARGKQSMLIIVAEGAMSGHEAGQAIAERLPAARVRVTVLGHLLRGGSPSSDDRILATRTGTDAVDALWAGNCCHHIGVIANEVVRTPLAEVLDRRRELSDELVRLVYRMAQ